MMREELWTKEKRITWVCTVRGTQMMRVRAIGDHDANVECCWELQTLGKTRCEWQTKLYLSTEQHLGQVA